MDKNQRNMQYRLYWEFLEIEDDTLHLYGFVSFYGFEIHNPQIYLLINENLLAKCDIYSHEAIRRDYTKGYISPPYNFRIKLRNISKCEVLKCRIFVNLGAGIAELTVSNSGRFFPIGKSFKEEYAMADGWMIRFLDTSLVLFRDGLNLQPSQEKKFLQELETINTSDAKEAIFLRKAYHAMKPLLQREVWLLSDRINKAGDNGEALFKYLRQHDCQADIYYILKEDSTEYQRLIGHGKVLAFMSLQHKLMHLLSDKLISSHADEYVVNPFLENFKFYRDILYNKKQIFLQHGIIHNNLSGWLNKHNRNLHLFITSAKCEYESIFNYNYHYERKQVVLTGLPRYDELKASPTEKLITIMPTWRFSMANASTFLSDGYYRYDDSFKNSHFFAFYNQLINNTKLINTIIKNGYKLLFMPHPNLISTLNLFDQNPHVEFSSIDTKYSEILQKSNLIITDYSSISFDFVYLRKPVLYCQFDNKTFLNGGHIYDNTKRFWLYEENGFGEVTYTLEDTVNCIIDYIEQDCQLKDKYRKRIDDFFTFSDKNNCQRVYEAILNMDKIEK